MNKSKPSKAQYLLIVGILVVVFIIFIVVDQKAKQEAANSSSKSNHDKIKVEETNSLKADNSVEGIESDLDNQFEDASIEKIANFAKEYYSSLISSSDSSSEGMESYNDIASYVKKGLEDKTYVVFSTYNVKFKDVNTLAPGMTVLYMKEDKTGKYSIINAAQNKEMNDYIKKLLQDPKIVKLKDKVNKNLENALKKDKALELFIKKAGSAN